MPVPLHAYTTHTTPTLIISTTPSLEDRALRRTAVRRVHQRVRELSDGVRLGGRDGARDVHEHEAVLLLAPREERHLQRAVRDLRPHDVAQRRADLRPFCCGGATE